MSPELQLAMLDESSDKDTAKTITFNSEREYRQWLTQRQSNSKATTKT
jgi:hypothetical protein